MATPASDSRDAKPRPLRPSGVMPAFRGSVSLPAPALRLASAPRPAPEPDDDTLWRAALAAAKERALVEEEERAWAAALERARALVAEEEREWATLRARALTQRSATLGEPRSMNRVYTWP